jgi:hypothetical protein
VVAIASVLLIVVLSQLITRIATLTLQVTGMSRDSARFQARSALTGAGFTTSESEAVVNHPVRRRVIMRLMLLGSAGIVTAVASLILSFRGGSTTHQLTRVGVLVGGLAALWWISRLDFVDRHLSRLIARFLRSRGLDARDYARLLDLSGDYGVAELQVQPGDWLAERRLSEVRLRDEGVLVLGIRRAGTYIGVPSGESSVRAGDTLILYGRSERIQELDDRRRDARGDQSHEQACAEQKQVEHLGAAGRESVTRARSHPAVAARRPRR